VGPCSGRCLRGQNHASTHRFFGYLSHEGRSPATETVSGPGTAGVQDGTGRENRELHGFSWNHDCWREGS
jgi:hypothetical protein